MNQPFLRGLLGFWLAFLLGQMFAPAVAGKLDKTRGAIPEASQSTSVDVPSWYRESFAIVIGESNYQYWPKLPGVKSDVKAVKEALEMQGFRVELAENQTSGELIQTLSDFLNRYGSRQQNRLLIYFAGHGHTASLPYGGEMGYIVPIDAPRPETNLASFTTRAISMQQIDSLARQVAARHAMFVFDACFAGSIFTIPRGLPQHISEQMKRPVRQFITSGSATQVVPDKSIFRVHLVQALTGQGDLNNDGFITGTELGSYLHDHVIDDSNGAQSPTYGKILDSAHELNQGEFLFQLALRQNSRLPKAILYLNSKPESVISVDGRRQQACPVIDLHVPPGKHRISFSLHDGVTLLEQQIDATSGKEIHCTAFFSANEIKCSSLDLKEP